MNHCDRCNAQMFNDEKRYFGQMLVCRDCFEELVWKRKQSNNEIKRTKKINMNLFLWFCLMFIIVIIGSVMNTTVILENNCRMPVYFSEYPINSSEHFSFQNPDEVNYHYLVDMFKLFNRIYSIGDLVMIGGFFLMIVFVVLMAVDYKRKTIKTKKT